MKNIISNHGFKVGIVLGIISILFTWLFYPDTVRHCIVVALVTYSIGFFVYLSGLFIMAKKINKFGKGKDD